jgi:hypothetical protein
MKVLTYLFKIFPVDTNCPRNLIWQIQNNHTMSNTPDFIASCGLLFWITNCERLERMPQ